MKKETQEVSDDTTDSRDQSRKRFAGGRTKWLAAAAILAAVAFGCSSVFEHIADQASMGGSDSDSATLEADAGGPEADTAGGFAQVDSTFTQASVSPGGISEPQDLLDGVVAPGEETRSFFTAFQVDPEAEDSAGPVFVVSGDVDKDGLIDLVTAWNQSQPILLHLQRRDEAGNIFFLTINLGGTSPIAVVAGVELGYIAGDLNDEDAWLDVVVLSKATGSVGLCPPESPGDPPTEISRLEGEIIVLFNPGARGAGLITDGDEWAQMLLVNPFVQDRWIHNQFPGNESIGFDALRAKPENAGYTALAVGDMNGDGSEDIVVSLNPGVCKNLGQEPPVNTIDLWINPGVGRAEDSASWGVDAGIGLSQGVPVSIAASAGALITDVTLSDIDGDGDLDVIAAWSDAITRNIRWFRNPFVAHQAGSPDGAAEVVAGVSAGPDICTGGATDGGFCPNGDADCLGLPDGDCLASVCVGGAADGQTCSDPAACIGTPDGVCTPVSWRFHATGWETRPIGQVETNANVIAIGDIDGDGFDDVLVRSTPGRVVQWFRRPSPDTIEPIFPPDDPVPDRFNFPWPVFTLTEFDDQEPEAIAIGDVTGDGQVEVLIAAGGAVFWYDGTSAETVFDPWSPNTIIQDSAPDAADAAAAGGLAPGTGVGVTGVDTATVINTLLVVDLDQDGRADIVGTLNRRSGAGLSDDRLVWYRNTNTEGEE